MRKIYLDNAATTAVASEVFAKMRPYFSVRYGNASEFHRLGREARGAMEDSRAKVAGFLGAEPREIIFTSSATESINLAHKGLVESRKKAHVITSSVEHKAAIESLKHLEKTGMAKVTYLGVDKYGRIRMSELKKAIRKETALISIMYVNNEVGTIQPIKEISELIKKRGQKIYLHTDATQAMGYLNCDVDELGVDMLSLTGHKIYAPKGVGALYVRKGTPVVRQMDGGGQEFGMRAGTENVPYVVGLGEAIEQISKFRARRIKKTERLRDKLIEEVLKIPKVKLTGHPKERVAHIASFVIDGAEGEAMVLYLSDQGVIASSGSACTSEVLLPSHVLTAMGLAPEQTHGSLRFSLGKETTDKEIDYVIKILPEVVLQLRGMAPEY